MVQLSLLGAEAPALGVHVHQVALRWLRSGAPGTHVDAAISVTESRFADWSGRALSGYELERVAAYFAGVMRRRLIGGQDTQSVEARRRLIAASVESDLRAAGWSAQRAVAEGCRVAGLPDGARRSV